jgi:hypothetical protein
VELQHRLHVAPIGPLTDPLPRLFQYKERVYNSLLSRNYLYDREPYVVNAYARQVEEVLPRLSPDVLFSPGTIPILRVKTEKPVVFWVDATFAGLLDFYPTYSNLCRETIASGHRLEQEALDRCRLAIYSSEWAARTALENYRVDPAKVRVVPFGANAPCTGSQAPRARCRWRDSILASTSLRIRLSTVSPSLVHGQF